MAPFKKSPVAPTLQGSASGDEFCMRLALQEAQRGAAQGEVPVGALVRDTRTGEILALAHNRPIGLRDPCAHAEILALRQAAQRIGDHRLPHCELFVTLEPCAMCAQAALHARVRRVVFGAAEPKTGAAGSVLNLFALTALNHQTEVTRGLLAEEAVELMRRFFHARRQDAKSAALPLRQDALRTPDAAFTLWPLPPPLSTLWFQEGAALNGLRLHVAQAWPDRAASPLAWLVLHGADAWGWAVYPWAQALAQAGQPVLAPDLIGFGRSDKPKKASWHTPQRHADTLVDLLQAFTPPSLGATSRWVVIAPPHLQTLVTALAHRLGAQWAGAIWLPDRTPGWPKSMERLPFPDAGHAAGPAAMKAWGRAEVIPVSAAWSPADLPHLLPRWLAGFHAVAGPGP